MPKKTKSAAKPKQSKTWLRRSKASKKGWEKRKEKAIPAKIKRAETLIDNAKRAKGKTPKPRKPNPRIGTSDKTVAQLKKRLAAAEKKLDELKPFEGWVDAKAPEWLHSDGSIAVKPSRLRHLKETNALRRLLKQAGKKSVNHLYELAVDMSEFYDLPLQEIYTLYWSP